MARKWRNLTLVSFICYILLIGSSYSETDTLLQGQQLKFGSQLVSASKNFRLGFLHGDGYIGIWYVAYGEDLYDDPDCYKIVVWSSRHRPINGSSPIPTMGSDGNLLILCRTGDPVAMTSVQGISAGSFTFGLDSTTNGTSQLVIWWGADVYWASGNWINESFSLFRGFPYKFECYTNEDEKYFTYHVNEKFISFARITIDRFGHLSDARGTIVSCRESYSSSKRVGCVDVDYPECRKDISDFDFKWGVVVSGNGFVFNESAAYDIIYCREKCLRDCSCVAYAATNERDETGCQIWTGLTIDTTMHGVRRGIYVIHTKENKWLKWLIIGVGLALAASSLCFLCLLIWRLLTDHARITDTLLRMLQRLLQIWRRSRDKVVEYLHSMKKANTEQEILLHDLGIHRRQNYSTYERNNHELHFFSFESIVSATLNFAPANKLGEGGFGPVYKGQFPDGQEVAIKRLSTNSRQGLIEFKNEVKVIAKLQHNNLVRLLGCCIEREEKILIYEYMPNKSLDFFLFDPMNKSALDWRTRFKIIEGIAQGLLYLHKYSRLKIIHRDLKAGNVLLDSDMNPKISDFGMAKIFGSDESKANTNRVVGTYGYMPPEYAFKGIFSTKSDVFSFGVLLLEITSGRRNNSFHYADGPLNLVVHAWELWNQGKASEMIDSAIHDEFQNEVLRCIHIGLLCSQENPTDRPSMLDVTSMLYNDAYRLPSPQKPAFYARGNSQDAEIAEQQPNRWSVNEVSMTDMEAR